jgi:hypothetical protein
MAEALDAEENLIEDGQCMYRLRAYLLKITIYSAYADMFDWKYFKSISFKLSQLYSWRSHDLTIAVRCNQCNRTGHDPE